MVAELGVKPEHSVVTPDDFDTEREPHEFTPCAVRAVAERYDIRDGILLAARYEEIVLADNDPCPEYIEFREDVYARFDKEASAELSEVVAKWNEYASAVDLSCGYSTWDEAESASVVLLDSARSGQDGLVGAVLP